MPASRKYTFSSLLGWTVLAQSFGYEVYENERVDKKENKQLYSCRLPKDSDSGRRGYWVKDGLWVLDDPDSSKRTYYVGPKWEAYKS